MNSFINSSRRFLTPRQAKGVFTIPRALLCTGSDSEILRKIDLKLESQAQSLQELSKIVYRNSNIFIEAFDHSEQEYEIMKHSELERAALWAMPKIVEYLLDYKGFSVTAETIRAAIIGGNHRVITRVLHKFCENRNDFPEIKFNSRDVAFLEEALNNLPNSGFEIRHEGNHVIMFHKSNPENLSDIYPD